jgi:GT2 family glycosyltransferase/SAM-dependent methyltransferase
VRPPVDVVVPFSGSAQALADVVGRLRRLTLGEHDTVTIVDNTRGGAGQALPDPSPIRVVRAADRQSAYYARNRGAAVGDQPWLLFLDGDVVPPPELVARYLAVEPGPRTAVLAGAVCDGPPASGRETLAGRYARLRRLIDQANTLETARPYAKTANCLVRREAFDAVGGFADDIRSGGDADLCFRLREAGWELELRPEASVEHHSRRHLPGLLGQRARHGSGAEWLEARYPGFVGPRRRLLGLVRDLARGAARAASALVRGDRDRALLALMDPVSDAAFDLGRRVPNAPWRELLTVPWRDRLRARLRPSSTSKGDAEFAYWLERKRAEGHLSNTHYERVYTTSFGLDRSDFAGKRVLDIGCGPRGSLEWATEASERVGLDPLVSRYRLLGIDAHQMTYVDSGAEDIPFPDGHFDIVASLNALDHVDDVDAAIGEMTRVTRSGGLGLVLVEVEHAPTATEPHSLNWNVLTRFASWEVVRERRVALDAAHNVHGSWVRGETWRSGPGLLGAVLRRR